MKMHLALIILGYILTILLTWYIYSDIKRLSQSSKTASCRRRVSRLGVAFLIFSGLVIGDLTVAVCLPINNTGSGIQTVFWLLYIYLTVLISEIVYFIFSVMGFILPLYGLVRGKRLAKWKTGLWIGLPLAILIFSLMWWGSIIGRRNIMISEIELFSPRLPQSFDGFKIAQISDLHVGTWGNDTTFISKLVDKVNSLHPDIIVFTGDLVNRESEELTPFLQTLSRLHADDGVLSILGNHDYGDYIKWSSPEEKKNNLNKLKDSQAAMGWYLLDNQFTSIKNSKGDSIIVIGVGNWGEPPFTKYGDLVKAYENKKDENRGLLDDNFKILLSHNPEHWNRQVTKISNIDLTLAGHTHAMQLMFTLGNYKWSPSKYKYDQWGGHYTKRNDSGDILNLYVNIGAGEIGLPMRVGASPEITLITLRSQKKGS